MSKSKDCNYCNNYVDCSGECPVEIECPLDNVVSTCTKDRSKARNRHHLKEKEKAAYKQNAAIIAAKAARIPKTAPDEQIIRAGKRCNNAFHKVH